MALIDCKFYSDSLKLSSSMTVILPQQTYTQIGLKNVAKPGKFRTLYLLHGLSDDHSIWLRRTSIERYVAPLGIAVVMPAVDRSFYTDMAFGKAYEEFVANELPKLCRSFFPISDKRSDTFVAGLSMGGYGAFKLALNYPDRFCAAASLSGVLDIARLASDTAYSNHCDFINIFGEKLTVKNTRNDLFFAARKLLKSGQKVPRLFHCCGDKDFLYKDNLRFRDFALSSKLPLTSIIDTGYGHTWDYWDLRIQNVLSWMLNA